MRLLPAEADHSPREFVVEQLVETATQPSQRPLILLVEDEVLIRLTSGEVLRDAGYNVVEAADGEEALALLESGLGPALIVSDIRMPGTIDGLKLLELVGKLHPAVPMLLASSHLPLDGNPRSDVAFLPKPYTPLTLVEAVHRLTGGR